MIESVKHETMADLRVYQASTYIFKLFLRFWNRLKIRGLENIPSCGGVLIVPNHASFLDPPVVSAGYRGRPIHFMARDTLWKSALSKWWMDHVGCISVSRGTGDVKAMRLTLKALVEGKAVSLFPEGTRSENGELREGQKGLGLIIEKSGCIVVPAYIDGTFRAFPKGAKWIRPVSVTIVFGKPIAKEEFRQLGTGRTAYTRYVALVMQCIAELKNEISRLEKQSFRCLDLS